MCTSITARAIIFILGTQLQYLKWVFGKNERSSLVDVKYVAELIVTHD